MSQNKRVALSLPPKIDDILTELSKLTAQPKTVIITELLSDSLPIFEQVIKAINEAKQGHEQLAIETMGKFLAETSNSLNQAHIEFGGVKAKHGKQ